MARPGLRQQSDRSAGRPPAIRGRMGHAAIESSGHDGCLLRDRIDRVSERMERRRRPERACRRPERPCRRRSAAAAPTASRADPGAAFAADDRALAHRLRIVALRSGPQPAETRRFAAAGRRRLRVGRAAGAGRGNGAARRGRRQGGRRRPVWRIEPNGRRRSSRGGAPFPFRTLGVRLLEGPASHPGQAERRLNGDHRRQVSRAVRKAIEPARHACAPTPLWQRRGIFFNIITQCLKKRFPRPTAIMSAATRPSVP